MRSRDGNRSITRAICSLILLNSLALDAKEFLISYRYMVKDATLYNETLSISPAMKKCSGNSHKSLVISSFGDDNIKLTIEKNSEAFLNFIHKLGLHVQHNEVTQNAQNKSTTILTLKTTCFKVDFNENSAKIAPLK
ncbi:hypothetical protein [Sulfurimonas sp.]|uniref:hypothetical protein n=1 Tax=Sulfurimonas sp. TaxID=2022749 RepID=UPI002AAFFB98|nr:hypothetical protein [Sulfurimonas sp.]